MKRDGCPLDAACYSAYLRGRDRPLPAPGGTRKPKMISAAEMSRRMLQSGYERLLLLELAPGRARDGTRIGSVERIRIQFAPPSD